MSFNQSRKLPTFRFDEHRIDDVEKLPSVTSRRYDDFLANPANLDSSVWLPPIDTIHSIVDVNTQKRQKAFLRAVAESDDKFPPQTIIASIMNYGSSIPGVVDRYLDEDYPSHEVFAYNRLGKHSMLNRKFGKECVTAMGHAYPESTELGQFENLRARVHRIIETENERLAVVSTKETVDRRQYNGRTSLLVSRVTGVARMDHAAMSPCVEQAIETLAEHHDDHTRMLGAKALLKDYVHEHDGDGAIVPVIQTMYQMQR